jgi:HIRAN domain
LPHRLYAAWQDENTRSWHTIGRLTRLANDHYEFVFTKGARVLGAMPKDLFGMNIFHSYRSAQLLPIFKNKLPSRSRSDYAQMTNWLNVSGNERDFDLLSKFGLIPGTDSTLVYPEPDVNSGRYSLEFFVHGVRYTESNAAEWCNYAQNGMRLLPLFDVQNPVDPEAVAIRPDKKNILLGYVPSFYVQDVCRILRDARGLESARITVVKCNNDAPPQLKLLCRFEAAVPLGFRALDSEFHQPLEQSVLRAAL